MAKADLTAPAVPAEVASLLGDYYGTHDGCLYRLTYYQGYLWQARCTTPAECPNADQFGEPYTTTVEQLRWLLDFKCFTRATF